jgi:hypothetical protein
MLTTQDAYEQMRKWFSDPRHEAGWDPDHKRCVYRGDEGAKSQKRCAVGCIMPDDLYDADLDAGFGVRISEMRDYTDALQSFFDGIDIDFLIEAQDAHDAMAETYMWDRVKFIDQLDLIAFKYCLDVPGNQAAAS